MPHQDTTDDAAVAHLVLALQHPQVVDADDVVAEQLPDALRQRDREGLGDVLHRPQASIMGRVGV